ncbi:RAP domain-containing protein [Endozoicomonas sp. GU-1]|uniref:RAP domain-containing protein n=1 Tax=Endozoicomonas sp. GU-1 TaxID=3009078 RepID=UPI0022B5462A|nr:RAP domain-containing protein [Endozoicomonas sp. GU-1]WBA79323.1 DUF1601 domain-containing protein [Endozoicomonas sp. GU-1]WBA86964.1 DUF1601 domain-containing protein [Endozoicomonas sp. GU-1]
MDRSSAGIGDQYAKSDNYYNRPGGHAASSSRGRYRHATVRRDYTPRTNPGRNTFYRSSDACPSQHLQRRSVTPAQDFNALIKQEVMDDLLSKSDRFGHRYDGRNHGLYANSIKQYTSAAKRPLNRAEQSQLTGLLQNFTITRLWDWRSLTTTLHSLTSAGVFTPHKPMDERVKLTQAGLLSTLLDAIIFKCSQKPQARDIDARGIANQLWAMAKLVDNGQQWTPEFKVAVTTLLPHMNAQKANFNPQELANLLWAMAKLVDNGLEQTPELKEAVAALLPRMNAQRAQFDAQHITNLLWAMAKLVDNGLKRTPGLKEAVTALLPYVKTQKDQFIPQGIANLLWAMAKLTDNGLERTPEFKEAVAALVPRVNAQKDQYIPQHIANLLWTMAKLVASGHERTPEFNEAVAALLPHVKAKKANFNPQEIANLLWAMAKLVDNGQERTPGLKEAVAALLPHVNAQKDQFNPQGITNLLWAMAKLVDHGQDWTPELKEAVAALLPHVNAQKANDKPQEIANLVWAIAKLVDNGLERTPDLNEAMATLLPLVIALKDQFKAQHITNLLWAMAKLVDNGQKRTPGLKEAVTVLLPHVNAQKDQFIPQGIANLLWAMAKLVDNGLERTPELNEAVAALLPHVNAQKDQFIPQHIANLLWAVAKLVDNGEWTPDLKEAVATLLHHEKVQKYHFIPQGIANLLWAMAKLGELVELDVVTSTFESLIYQISKNPQLSQQDTLMSLWGVMVYCARLSLVSNASKNNRFEKYIDNLFARLQNTSPDNKEDQRTIAMAASWLGRPCPFVPHYHANVSKRQSDFRNQLQSCIPSLRIEEEKCLNSLPPVDLLLPDHNMVIEIQGPSHYVSGDFKTRNGSTLLKIALLQKSGFEVIEIPVNQLWKRDFMKPCIDHIKTRQASHHRRLTENRLPYAASAPASMSRKVTDEA